MSKVTQLLIVLSGGIAALLVGLSGTWAVALPLAGTVIALSVDSICTAIRERK